MKMKLAIVKLLSLVLLGTLLIQTPVYAAQVDETSVVYCHDPRRNSAAMADIVVDPNAIYGFAPSKDSTRLAEFANADWSDPVAVEGWRQERIEYLSQFESMYDLWDEMQKKGCSTEEIAKAVSAKRNEVRLASYVNDPEGLEKVKKSNLETYGNENGPTADSLFEKYGSWEKVLLKSFSSNAGMDACLGLYDEQYEHNNLINSIVEDQVVTYTVKDNDYLAKIAQKYYGSQGKWKIIYEANKDQIKSEDLIYEGQKLVIPLD